MHFEKSDKNGWKINELVSQEKLLKSYHLAAIYYQVAIIFYYQTVRFL